MSDEQFYFAFEHKFRVGGSQAEHQLRVYSPFIDALKHFRAIPVSLDLGCGRGEWLSVLREAGFEVRGVDTDPVMLNACRDKGLSVEEDDAGAFLSRQPDDSLDLISAFHLIEHLPFEQQQLLVRESHRALRPGGLLVLETPNPENLIVGTANFYLDPTHIKPVPSQLLEFLPEYYGFKRVRILRLNQRTEPEAGRIELFSVLNGVGPDLAVVAQKNTETAELAMFDDAFAISSGPDLASLSESYDQRLLQGFKHTEELAQHLIGDVRMFSNEVRSEIESLREQQQGCFQQLSQHLQTFQTYQQERDIYHAQLQEKNAQLHEQHRIFEEQRQQLETQAQQISALLNSSSWRLTTPLRGCARLLRTAAEWFGWRKTSTEVIHHPPFQKSPQHLSPPHHDSAEGNICDTESDSDVSGDINRDTPSELPPQAAAIYRQLKKSHVSEDDNGVSR